MPTPTEYLEQILIKAKNKGINSVIEDKTIQKRIDYVCRCLSNRAGVRLLMACMLAKIDDPKIDPRKPYTEIGGKTSFSGRTYDEQYITHFINKHQLPCNTTTAFLTPALRNHNSSLLPNTDMVGRPPQLYKDTIQLLDDVANKRINAEKVLTEVIRILVLIRDEKRARMETLIASLKNGRDALPLSAEAIVSLLQQHLACKNSSRLPVLIIAAAYKAAEKQLGEKALPLKSHNAADEQTGASGDVEVCLINDDKVITIYEMKSKHVTIDDIDRALQKLVGQPYRIDNYVFITTDVIEDDIREYAACFYEKTNGTEIVVLDCIGFIRHFLHLFHRIRLNFLDEYQSLLLLEPDSAVNQPLKEAFLTLRQAAESDE